MLDVLEKSSASLRGLIWNIIACFCIHDQTTLYIFKHLIYVFYSIFMWNMYLDFGVGLKKIAQLEHDFFCIVSNALHDLLHPNRWLQWSPSSSLIHQKIFGWRFRNPLIWQKVRKTSKSEKERGRESTPQSLACANHFFLS